VQLNPTALEEQNGLYQGSGFSPAVLVAFDPRADKAQLCAYTGGKVKFRIKRPKEPSRRCANHMAKMIQIRNIPDTLHRKLKARAVRMGMSLSDYLSMEIKEIAERPTLTEFRERLHSREPVGPIDIVGLLHVERGAQS
jgi:antitoxin FitA